MLRPYHPAQGRRKVGPSEVHLAAGRGGIRAEPILFSAIRPSRACRGLKTPAYEAAFSEQCQSRYPERAYLLVG